MRYKFRPGNMVAWLWPGSKRLFALFLVLDLSAGVYTYLCIGRESNFLCDLNIADFESGKCFYLVKRVA